MIRRALDFLAVAAPAVCAVHCLAVPLVLVLLPAACASDVLGPIDDRMMALAMVALCVPAIVPGYVKHKKPGVLAFMGLGLGLVLFASFTEDLVGQFWHIAASVLGSICLIKANLDNRRLASCCALKHAHSVVTIDNNAHRH